MQTTFRVDKTVLCRARMVLNLQGRSVTEYLVEKLQEVAASAPDNALTTESESPCSMLTTPST